MIYGKFKILFIVTLNTGHRYVDVAYRHVDIGYRHVDIGCRHETSSRGFRISLRGHWTSDIVTWRDLQGHRSCLCYNISLWYDSVDPTVYYYVFYCVHSWLTGEGLY